MTHNNDMVFDALDVIDLRVDGGAVARHNGKVVFLNEGVPGDTVQAKAISHKKNIIDAEVLSILSPSPHRQTPWCPHYGECGGCTWQHITPEFIKSWKYRHVTETLRRIGKVSIPVMPVIGSPMSRGYRTKVSYAFGTDDQGLLSLGLRQRLSKTVIPITYCGLQPEAVASLLQNMREEAQRAGIPAWDSKTGEGYLRFFAVHTPQYKHENKTQTVIEVITGPDSSGTYKALLQPIIEKLHASGQVTGVLHLERSARADIAAGEKELFSWGTTDIFEKYNNTLLAFPYDAFMQTNTGAATLLYDKIKECVSFTGTKCIWDLYCGVGAIGLHLADISGMVCGNDIQKKAIAYARKNYQRAGRAEQESYHAGSMVKAITYFPLSPEVIIVDPPRAGLSTELIEFLNTLKTVHTLMYISCDVATQARDIRQLSNWQAQEAYPVDMFPNTPHIENIVLLKHS